MAKPLLWSRGILQIAPEPIGGANGIADFFVEVCMLLGIYVAFGTGLVDEIEQFSE